MVLEKLSDSDNSYIAQWEVSRGRLDCFDSILCILRKCFPELKIPLPHDDDNRTNNIYSKCNGLLSMLAMALSYQCNGISSSTSKLKQNEKNNPLHSKILSYWEHGILKPKLQSNTIKDISISDIYVHPFQSTMPRVKCRYPSYLHPSASVTKVRNSCNRILLINIFENNIYLSVVLSYFQQGEHTISSAKVNEESKSRATLQVHSVTERKHEWNVTPVPLPSAAPVSVPSSSTSTSLNPQVKNNMKDIMRKPESVSFHTEETNNHSFPTWTSCADSDIQGEEIFCCDSPLRSLLVLPVATGTASPDASSAESGVRVAVGSNDRSVRTLRLSVSPDDVCRTGGLARPPAILTKELKDVHKGSVYSLSWHPTPTPTLRNGSGDHRAGFIEWDCGLLASGSNDKSVRVTK